MEIKRRISVILHPPPLAENQIDVDVEFLRIHSQVRKLFG